MAIFSCYVSVERFLGVPVKELVKFLVCLPEEKRESVILSLSYLLQKINRVSEFKKFSEKDLFLHKLPLKKEEKEHFWNLIENFYFRHSENLSGKEIPQDDLLALRKGRLFEEIVFHLGPLNHRKVELACMHCQPMVNRRKVRIFSKGKELSNKNIDVVFWGKDYVEGFECKGNVEFFLRLSLSKNPHSQKVKEKVVYLHLLSKVLKKKIKNVNLYLSSFASNVDLDFCHHICSKILREFGIGDTTVEFKITTIKDFLKSTSCCENSKEENL